MQIFQYLQFSANLFAETFLHFFSLHFLFLIVWFGVLFCRYQNELPKRIKSRGKDAHLIHEELVQTMKWKQTVSWYIFLLEIS